MIQKSNLPRLYLFLFCLLCGQMFIYAKEKGPFISHEVAKEVNRIAKPLIDQSPYTIGFPATTEFDYSSLIDGEVGKLLKYVSTNNAGSPYDERVYGLSNRSLELYVIEHYAKLYNFDNPWGYLTHGGTGGNMEGLYKGRDILRLKSDWSFDGDQKKNPILYVNREAHHSIKNIGRLLSVKVIQIDSNQDGSMNYDDLEKKLGGNIDSPALFGLTIGTTFKGAIDDHKNVFKIVQKLGIKNYYFHLDAALFGGYLPYVNDVRKPDLDFSKYPYLDSLAISGHKYNGLPIPAGIFLTKKENINMLNFENIGYLSSKNTTILCSRNAITPFLWSARVMSIIEKDEKEKVNNMLERTRYLKEELNKLEGVTAHSNMFSNIVYFTPRPSDMIMKKFSLAPESEIVDGETIKYAHVVVMPHVNENTINMFLHEMKNEFNIKK